jgi:predicted membrane chloride channel (bestrophin family)
MPLQAAQRQLSCLSDVVPCRVGLTITHVAVAAMFFLCTAAVAAYHTLHNAQVFPSWVPCLPLIPIEPFQLTSFALSLLLVFRTNSSYSRWYEGRRRFGRITTTCRDICRQVRLSRQAVGRVALANHVLLAYNLRSDLNRPASSCGSVS